jgi:hypothetical protein
LVPNFLAIAELFLAGAISDYEHPARTAVNSGFCAVFIGFFNFNQKEGAVSHATKRKFDGFRICHR